MHLGIEAEQRARAYALRAERKMGEMLRETDRANVARDKKKAELPDVTPPPTLSSLGLTKRESAEAQEMRQNLNCQHGLTNFLGGGTRLTPVLRCHGRTGGPTRGLILLVKGKGQGVGNDVGNDK